MNPNAEIPGTLPRVPGFRRSCRSVALRIIQLVFKSPTLNEVVNMQDDRDVT